MWPNIVVFNLATLMPPRNVNYSTNVLVRQAFDNHRTNRSRRYQLENVLRSDVRVMTG